MRRLAEDEALVAVMAAIRQLFPLVPEQQSRDLARTVIRDLARRGVVLAEAADENE